MKSSSGYELYHNTLSGCLDEVERYVQSKGYEAGDYFPVINHIAYGQTERTHLELLKNGQIANSLAIQIYRMDSGRYELNCYPVKKFATGDIVGKTMHEFKRGELHSSSGQVVRNPKQAIAIGLSKERRGKFATGGYTRPAFDLKTTGVYLFRTNKGTFTLVSYLFERDNDTEDSLEIQEELKGLLGSINIKNSAWKRLASGKSVKAKSTRGNYFGTLTRIDDINNALKYSDGGKVLWAVKKGEPDWNEQIITEKEERIEDAKKWATQNGFDRFRIATIDLKEKPDFKKTFDTGGGAGQINVGERYLYKFDNKIYEVLGVGEKQVAICPLPIGSFWNDRIVSKSLMQKWVKNKMMIKQK